VNCDTDWKNIPAVSGVEGIAGTTPLVLDAGFDPFGREPRQFDAFYLGSKEAFAKPLAFVDLSFVLGSAVSTARAAIGIADGSYWTFGVSEDSRLQIIAHGVSAAGAPTVRFPPLAVQPETGEHRPIPLNTGARPGAVSVGSFPHVSVASGAEVWVWRQVPGLPDWSSQGIPVMKPDGTTPPVTETMLTRAVSGAVLYAVADGVLYARAVDGNNKWAQVFPAPSAGAAAANVKVVKVVPILGIDKRPGEQQDADGIVLVTDQGEIWFNTGGGWKTPAGGPAEVDKDFYPLAVRTAAGAALCATCGKPAANQSARPVAFDLNSAGVGYSEGLTLVGHTLGFRPIDDRIVVVMIAAAAAGGTPDMYVWDAFANKHPVRDTKMPPALVEGPIEVGRSGATRVFFSAGRLGEAFIAPIGQIESVSGAHITDAVWFTDALNDWTVKDHGFPVDLDPTGTPGVDVGFVKNVYRGTVAGAWRATMRRRRPTFSCM
jgi:hypothetical protein